MIAPVRARVPGYTQHHGEYWFNVEASMEDGRKWSLQRLYKDFYALQLALMEQFPDAAGQIEGIERTLPFMPGPVPFVTDQLTGQRQAHLDVYLAQLLKIRVDITNCQSVRMFFFPRQGDAEVSNDDRDSGYRQSLSSRQSAAIRDSRHSSVSGGNTSNNNIPQSHSPLRPQQSTPDSLPENMHPQHLQQQQYLPQAQYQKPQNPHLLLHQLTVPHSASPPPILRNGSALSMVSSHPNASYTSLAQQPSLPQLQSTHQQQPHPHLNTPAKVKVWFGDTNCVVVRLPPQYTYPELLSKLRERWALEQQASREEVESVTLAVDYKDENTGAFYTIEGEEDLSIAKEREKLTLRVMAISPFE
jgi:bud emergence protein 1